MHGISQALEQVTISFSRGSSRPGTDPVSPALRASPVALVVKNSPANAGRRKRRGFDPWVEKIP